MRAHLCGNSPMPGSAFRAAPTYPAVPPQAAGRGGGGGANRVQLLIQGPDIQQLQVYVADLLAKVRTIPGIVDADTNFEATAQELRVRINRTRAADLGVSIDSLATNLRLLVGGDEVSKYKEGDDQFAVKLRLDEQFRNDPARMGELLVPGAGGRPLRVNDIASLALEPGPANIDRYNRQRQISLNGGLDGIPMQICGQRSSGKGRRNASQAGLCRRFRLQRQNAEPGLE